MYVRFNGEYEQFITGRDVDSAVHYHDTKTGGVGIVETVRDGDTPITQEQYLAEKESILAYNRALPQLEDPVSVTRDQMIALALEEIAKDPALSTRTRGAATAAADSLKRR